MQVTEHIIPFANLSMGDEIGAKLKERNCRWVPETSRDPNSHLALTLTLTPTLALTLALTDHPHPRWVLEKWRDRLAYPFTVYATIEDSGSVSLMDLREFLAMVRDANLIDEGAVSEYRVKQFFAVVNLADELFEAAGGC